MGQRRVERKQPRLEPWGTPACRQRKGWERAVPFQVRGTSRGTRGGVCRHTDKGPLGGDTEETIRQPSRSTREEEVQPEWAEKRGTPGSPEARLHSAATTNVPWLETKTTLNPTDQPWSQKREFPENAHDVAVGDTQAATGSRGATRRREGGAHGDRADGEAIFRGAQAGTRPGLPSTTAGLGGALRTWRRQRA